ncbi:MAG: DUF1906 domain-containing protein [Cellulomonadaceae bacterium]|jgi:peptidoglycan hydrolase-like protein with peptidoglycan-binding domain|nr:DUF1906 domain-containing protein [Cellulomonadaceae bacterium]
MSALGAFGNISSGNFTPNIANILIAGLYCKGYNAGNGQLPGSWLPQTTTAVNSIQSHIGIPQTGIITPTLFRAILNMDAYIVIGNGQQFVREVQQWMNATYLNRSWYSIIPADGSYSRTVQTALVYAIQEELNVAGANGNYGPGTRAAVQAKGAIAIGNQDGPGRNWIRLFQAAMRFNLYPVAFDGSFSVSDSAHVVSFQNFTALPISGQGDYQTWSSLLVSNGDPNRVGTAADTITQVTAPRASTLIANGRQVIGRYLTNASSSSALNKKIQPGELAVIFGAGLRVFPIYQTYGSYLSYFSDIQGQNDAFAAIEAATEYGFLRNTFIYFAVDFDATDDQITSNVIPHFEAINTVTRNFNGMYRVGIYGTRNVCSRISQLGLAESSFVSGMSTGYSGNLGFHLPSNWAFDQISTITLGTGGGAIEIDNNIASGRDLGQSSINSPPTGEKLDVQFDMALHPSLASAILAYINSPGADIGNTLGLLEPDPAVILQRVLAHDLLITNLARTWGIRKALIQSIAFWENWKTRWDDLLSNYAVIIWYSYLEQHEAWLESPVGPEPQPPSVIQEDSSTGFAQVFANTAILAQNWAIESDFADGILLDNHNWRDMWAMWQLIHTDLNFSIAIVPTVLMWGADRIGVLDVPRLTFADHEIEAILARYNGTNTDADAVGARVKHFYDIFEQFNASLRS